MDFKHSNLARKIYKPQAEKQFRRALKRQYALNISTNPLHLIKHHALNAHEFNWIHDDEFRYRGSLYDVLSVEKKGDTLVYTTWWDAKENQYQQAIKRLAQSYTSQLPLHQQHQERFQLWLKSLFVFEQPTADFTFYSTRLKTSHNIKGFLLTGHSRHPIKPPIRV